MILKNFRYKKNEYFIFCIKKKKKKKKQLYFVVYFVLHLTELKKRIVYQNMVPPLIMRLIMRYFDSEKKNILIQKTNL